MIVGGGRTCQARRRRRAGGQEEGQGRRQKGQGQEGRRDRARRRHARLLRLPQPRGGTYVSPPPVTVPRSALLPPGSLCAAPLPAVQPTRVAGVPAAVEALQSKKTWYTTQPRPPRKTAVAASTVRTLTHSLPPCHGPPLTWHVCVGGAGGAGGQAREGQQEGQVQGVQDEYVTSPRPGLLLLLGRYYGC